MNKNDVRDFKITGLLFNCDSCSKPIETPAALLFSPPKSNLVRKHHICSDCYMQIIKQFNEK